MARDYPDSFAPEPVDRVAGRVISAGTHHEFKKQENCREVWNTPPEVVPLFLVPQPVRELFGSRKGSLVVVGYLGRRNNKQGVKTGQRLLARCDCGRYEVRIAHHWKKLRALDNYCQFCQQREKLKLSHLSNAERDRLEDVARARAGLPLRSELENEANKRRKEHSERMLASLLMRR